MGRSDELMVAREDRRRNEIIARYVGLTPEEVENMDLEIQAITTSDDAQVGYYFEVPEYVPDDILKKMERLEDRTVYLPINIFDETDQGE